MSMHNVIKSDIFPNITIVHRQLTSDWSASLCYFLSLNLRFQSDTSSLFPPISYLRDVQSTSRALQSGHRRPQRCRGFSADCWAALRAGQRGFIPAAFRSSSSCLYGCSGLRTISAQVGAFLPPALSHCAPQTYPGTIGHRHQFSLPEKTHVLFAHENRRGPDRSY